MESNHKKTRRKDSTSQHQEPQLNSHSYVREPSKNHNNIQKTPSIHPAWKQLQSCCLLVSLIIPLWKHSIWGWESGGFSCPRNTSDGLALNILNEFPELSGNFTWNPKSCSCLCWKALPTLPIHAGQNTQPQPLILCACKGYKHAYVER